MDEVPFQYDGDNLRIRVSAVKDLVLLDVRSRSTLDQLTQRKYEVAEHFGRRLSYKEIAKALGVSPATIRNHLQSIYKKLEISNKAKLIALLQARVE